MIFKDNWRRIKSGQATALAIPVADTTREKWERGTEIPVQPGVGQKSVCRIRVKDLNAMQLNDMTLWQILCLGYSSREEFIGAWDAAHDVRVGDNPRIWYIQIARVP